MSDRKAYKIEIESDFPRFWRYNIAVTCGLMDADNRQIGFVPAEDKIAPIGSNLDKCPAVVAAHRRFVFTADDCAMLRMFVYIIPHTLPTEKLITDCKPFRISIKVSYAGTVIVNEKHEVNQWSGASIEITARRPE